MTEHMTKRTIVGLVTALFALLLLQACSQESEPPTSPATAAVPAATTGAMGNTAEAEAPAVDTSAAVSPDQGYPPLLEEIEPGSGYPEPGDPDYVDLTNRPELPEVEPTPEPAMAVVSGIILDDRTEAAPPEAALFLGRIVTTDTGMRVVRLEQAEDPYAVPEADGRFLFPTVEPGEYGLILVHPDISFVVDDPDTGHSLIFTVEPGQSLDLGTIVITLP